MKILVAVLTLVVGLTTARAEPLVVVNVAGDAAERERARARTVELRDHLIDAGAARHPVAELAGVVVGEPGDEPAPPYRLDLSDVRRSYAAFEYARAQQLLAGEIAPALAGAATAELANTIAELLYWRGKVAVADGSRRAAMTWFHGVLDLAPQWSVDAAVDPPSVQKAFTGAGKRRAKRARGTLQVVAAADSLVSIDGGAEQSLPVSTTLGVGPHLVVVTRVGHLRHAELVMVSPRAEVVVSAVVVAESAATLMLSAVLEVAAAAPRERLAAMRAVGVGLGCERVLAVEGDGGELFAVLYDLESGEVSAGVALGDAGIPTEVSTLAGVKVVAPPVLDLLPADPLVSAGPSPDESSSGKAWYRRWWVWGAAAGVLGASSLIYFTRDRAPELSCCGAPR